MQHDIYIYILLMSLVTLAIRIVPLTLIRGEVKSTFLRSFLYYVPYVTLAVMTFPAIMETTRVPLAGAAAFLFALWLSWNDASLFRVAAGASIMVFIVEGVVFWGLP